MMYAAWEHARLNGGDSTALQEVKYSEAPPPVCFLPGCLLLPGHEYFLANYYACRK
jgi:hypothetical protein